jgi:hypothetical protein
MGIPDPKLANPSLICIFGDAGVVQWGKGKMGDQGIAMEFMFYTDDHSADCYRIWYPSTWKITESHDFI